MKKNALSPILIAAAAAAGYFFFTRDSEASPLPGPDPIPGPDPTPTPTPTPVPPPPPEPPQILKLGDKSLAVKKWQRLLCAFYDQPLGDVHGEKFVDGGFGPLTEQYTRGFQEMHNEYSTDKLTVDGEVGPLTQKSMQDYFAKGQDPKGRSYQQASTAGVCFD